MFTRNHVARLQKKSANIINVFSSTVEQLDNVNQEISKHKTRKLDKISKLQQEHADLHVQQEANNRMINKINQFLK
jgi:hypothetical protein